MDLDDARWLASEKGREVLDALPPYAPDSALAVGERLRRTLPPNLAAAVALQSRLRARGRAKLGARVDRLLLTQAGLEQATRPVVAAMHAARLAEGAGPVRGRSVADLGCGIGTDSAALLAAGCRVRAVELDPVTAVFAAANLAPWGEQVTVETVDATTYDLNGVVAVFADPSRRSARGRTFDPEAYRPRLSWVLGLAAGRPVGVKVAPGVPHDLAPHGWETAWVSVDGDVVEAGLWSPGLASAGVRRSATVVRDGGSSTLTDRDLPSPASGPVRAVLLEPDGAVLRAGLVGHVAAACDGTLLDPSIAYVTADDASPTPFARRYAVVDVLPFQLKRLRARLRELGTGDVVVKKRGSAVEPEELRRRLRLDGDGPTRTLVLTRVAGRQTVIVTDPLPG